MIRVVIDIQRRVVEVAVAFQRVVVVVGGVHIHIVIIDILENILIQIGRRITRLCIQQIRKLFNFTYDDKKTVNIFAPIFYFFCGQIF